MSHEAQIHPAQTKILRELLFLPETNFAELQKVSGLESDHVKFHIKRLVELDYVEKAGSRYRLTIKGKEYANKLDTDAGVIERQPKVAVLLIVEREVNGVKQYLLQQRRKHPYFGYWGAPTGKIRWGESILETATRELAEETGLRAEFTYQGINHERVRHQDTGEFVEDKIFHLMFTDRASGVLKDEFDGGQNVWRTMAEMKTEPKKYKGFYEEMEAGIAGGAFLDHVEEYTKEEF